MRKQENKDYFVKIDTKNNISQNSLEHNLVFTDTSRTGNHIILNEGGVRLLKVHRKMQPSSIIFF